MAFTTVSANKNTVRGTADCRRRAPPLTICAIMGFAYGR